MSKLGDSFGSVRRRLGFCGPTRTEDYGLAVFDDVFPNILSAFRVAEFNTYLDKWPDAHVYTKAGAFNKGLGFSRCVDDYAAHYPHLRSRVHKFSRRRRIPARAAYTVFLNNAFQFIDAIESAGAPFAFTLYPGGGFRLDDNASDAKLARVCSSRLFRTVIATQSITKEYLLSKGFCSHEKVEFVYGGAFPSDRLTSKCTERRYYGQNKSTFDICFVAHKYMAAGVDKGFDLFVDVAKTLATQHDHVFFHVVGPFDESDRDVSAISNRIRFYGTMHTDSLAEFYASQDLILSPNLPFVLAPGAFDGFPTGCCIEAGVCGTAVFCTDRLGQNIAFQDGKEIVIIPHDVESICAIISAYCLGDGRLVALAQRGQEAFRRVFDLSRQMDPRLSVVSELLS